MIVNIHAPAQYQKRIIFYHNIPNILYSTLTSLNIFRAPNTIDSTDYSLEDSSFSFTVRSATATDNITVS
jgi:ABC-type microcin C transport system permease subunit YejE